MKAIVIDHGLSIELALLLARGLGGEVGFYSPWASSFADPIESMVGTGLEDFGVKRIDFPWSLIDDPDEPDIWVFPDLYFSDWQQVLRGMGKTVWGSGDGELLELDRWKLHEILTQAKLPVPRTETADGIEQLRAYLGDMPGPDHLFIKLAQYYRGLSETYEMKPWPASRSWYEDIARRAGPVADKLRFMLQLPIEGDSVEPGLDLLIVNGQLLRPYLLGYEDKDNALISKVLDDIPAPLRESLEVVIDALGPYSNFFSGEWKVTKDGIVYFLDATCRMPHPGDGAHLKLCTNLSEVITAPDIAPDYSAQYCCQLMLNSPWAKDHPLHVRFPEEYRDNLLLYHFFCDDDGEYWILPHGQENVVAVVTTGDDLEACKKECIEIAESVEADQLTFKRSAFDEIEKMIEKGEGYGMP